MIRRSWSVINNSELDSSDEGSTIVSLYSQRSNNSKNLIEKWVYKDSERAYQFNDFESQSSDNETSSTEEDNKRLTYCYLCSIKAHIHKKTQPVPVNKRRYLRPYLNPFDLVKKLERENQQTAVKTNYKFLIQTGSAPNNGTDATVWFKIYGTAGIWEATQLRPNRTNVDAKFTPGSLVEIDLEGPVIGDLKRIKIWHTGKSLKDNWYLDFIEIICSRLKQTWRFICDQWLSKTENSNSVILSLKNNMLDSEKAKNLTEYAILIKTSTKPLVGQDINVQFQFVCSKGQTQVFNLLTPHVNLFEPLQLDCFLIRSTHDLGKPEKLRMAHNARKSAHEWSIDYIRVYYSRDPGNFYSFKVDKWLEKNDKMNAIISMNSVIPVLSVEKSGETGKMIHHISVITGNVRFGGTDAKVYIQLKGTKGLSEIHRLHNSKSKKEFERGQIDHFYIFDKDIGQLKLAKVWHDNSGSAPGWFLQAVLVKSLPTTITGKEEKTDSEVKDQIEKIIKKYKIQDLQLEDYLRGGSNKNKTKRAKSADTNSKKSQASGEKSPRSLSADSNKSESSSKKDTTVSYKDVLKKNHEKSKSLSDISRSSPTPSILKTSASPRRSGETTRKSVKFDPSDSKNEDPAKKKSTSPSGSGGKQEVILNPIKPEMNITWIMSIFYGSHDSNQIKAIKTIENYDKSIKNIDNKLVESYNSKMKKIKPKAKDGDEVLASSQDSKEELSKIKGNPIYVFECNKWLAKDMDDRKIERVIKLSNILPSK